MYPDAPKRNLESYLRFKRVLDVAISVALLVAFSPLLLLIAILLKIESPRSPIIYISQRVGKGYKIFDFYKFRTMRASADLSIGEFLPAKKRSKGSIGAAQSAPISSIRRIALEAIGQSNHDSSAALFSDDGWISEAQILADDAEDTRNVFAQKTPRDPRVTVIGRLLRKTSLDELPQLWNVILGDMSIVGNRPLPPNEAEKLTTDVFVQRFMAPGGITGLWQVTERGGDSEVDSESRKQLDVEYAKRCSFWLDLYIMLRTPAAALRHDVG